MTTASPSIRPLQLRSLEKQMRNAVNYEQWQALAREHDAMSGADRWRADARSRSYDEALISSRSEILRRNLVENNVEETLFALNEGIHGNLGGMGKASMYRHAKCGTKQHIDQYINLMIEALEQVASAPESSIRFDEKFDFFRRASHCYGRSALTMSGGGGLIYFHHGVVQTLVEHRLLPEVICGSSAGAWMAAQIGTRTDRELRHHFRKQRYNLTHGDNLATVVGLYAGIGRQKYEGHFMALIDDVCGDMTFQEAFEHTGRKINISVTPEDRKQSARLMNAITSPNVTIRSAVRASSSLPGVLGPRELEAKDSRGRLKSYMKGTRWLDASLSDDLPFKRIARLYGVNHYIVSMINPIATPFLQGYPEFLKRGIPRSIGTLTRVAMRESIRNSRRWLSPITGGRVDSLMGTFFEMLNQDYIGDVNLILPQSAFKTRYIAFDFRREAEIEKLILAGERATWPELARIRNASRVSKVIDRCLEKLEQESMTSSHRQQLHHITR